MAELKVAELRNMAVVGHGGGGKTTLVECLLHVAGAIDRLGSVQAGTTTTDYEPEEIERKISLGSAVAHLSYQGHRLYLVDTPGFINFLEDTRGALRAVDGALLVASAAIGLKAEALKLWKFMEEFELPTLIALNEMDKEMADFPKAVAELERLLKKEVIPLQVPIGSGETFQGVVDLLSQKAYIYQEGKPQEAAPPPEAQELIEEFRKKLVEKIAEADDALLTIYLEGGELSQEELLSGIKVGSLSRSFLPLVCTSGAKNIGAHGLLEAVLLTLPSPEEAAKLKPIKGKNPKTGAEQERFPSPDAPLSAYVFKTIADPFAGRLSLIRVYSGMLKADSTVLNASTGTKERIGQVFLPQGKKQVPAQRLLPGELGVVAKLKDTHTGDTLCAEASPIVFEPVRFAEPIISYAIAPKSKGDEEKVSTALQRILEEDPALHFHRDEETKEMLLGGMGQLHLEVALQKLKRKFGVEVQMKTPKIPYRETITARAKAQGKYKKQTGGRGQYGDCWIEIEPLPRGKGFEFVDKIVGGVIPQQYRPAVEKGIVEAMKEGILAGYPMVDVKVTLYDGSYHSVDSSEMAFKIAGSLAIKKAAMEARPVLLEPIMKVEVLTPEETLGAVIGDLNAKRAKVQGMEPEGSGMQKITALVPMAEMLTYANQLHSLTSGRGMYTMEFSHYEQVPQHIAQKLIEEKQRQKKEQ
jgi:elongation factor G